MLGSVFVWTRDASVPYTYVRLVAAAGLSSLFLCPSPPPFRSSAADPRWVTLTPANRRRRRAWTGGPRGPGLRRWQASGIRPSPQGRWQKTDMKVPRSLPASAAAPLYINVHDEQRHLHTRSIMLINMCPHRWSLLVELERASQKVITPSRQGSSCLRAGARRGAGSGCGSGCGSGRTGSRL